MVMRKIAAAASPGAYVGALGGWQGECVKQLRRRSAPQKATQLMRAALSVNRKLGDPTKAPPKRRSRAS